MSAPHTGKLEAIINGLPCRFNGDQWTTPDPRLTRLLNGETDSSSKTHTTIRELAEHVFRKAGLAGEITSVEMDRWDEDLPEGAVD